MPRLRWQCSKVDTTLSIPLVSQGILTGFLEVQYVLVVVAVASISSPVVTVTHQQ
jgi:hypothetical protein